MMVRLFITLLYTSLMCEAESDISEVDYDDALDETLLDRVAALKDIVPPTYRKNLSSITSTGYSWASSAVSFSGKTLWVVSTSALLLGVPWALAFSEEQQVQEMEREMRMQQSANEVCCSAALAQRARSGIDGADWIDAVVDARWRCWTDGREACAMSSLRLYYIRIPSSAAQYRSRYCIMFPAPIVRSVFRSSSWSRC